MVTAAMVGIDADRDQPGICSTFTTRDRITAAGLRAAQAYIVKLVRSEIPDARYCSFVEFTTGKGQRSGGIRRPHLHALWKGIAPEDAPLVAGAAVHVMEQAAGAWRHQVDEIRTPAGATMYVARHHLKESQAPPPSWGSLRRVRPSRGYWSKPAEQLRTEATAIVREKRIRSAMEALCGDAGPELDTTGLADELVGEALRRPAPEVVRVRELRGRMVEVKGGV